MISQQIIILSAFAFLLFKHFIFDFPLQSDYQLRTKGIYGHWGGIFHAALHALGTLPVYLLFQPAIGLVLAIVATEFVLHYHIDWSKEHIQKSLNWNSGSRGFWLLLGADQMLHNFTYIGIVGVLWIRM